MIKVDLHTHTNFCDGKNTPEEMVLSAIEKGLKTFGMVVHSHTAFDDCYCVSVDGEKQFKATVNELKKKYADKIEILLGIEQDIFSTYPAVGYDYIIGSSHYFLVDGKYYHVDYSEIEFVKTVKNVFNGDYYLAAENYYNNLKNGFKNTNASIVGHVDLINKFNENDKLFSTNHPRYIKAFKDTIDALITYNARFEINTGAIARGSRTKPYPQEQIRDYIKQKGGKFILSSDAHSIKNIAFGYKEWQDYAK